MRILFLTFCLISLNSVLLAAEKFQEPIYLRDLVDVNHTTVLLSDLLPLNVSQRVQQSSEAVPLCRAPQTGSSRTLRVEQIMTALTTHADLVRQMVVPSMVVIRSSGWPISEAGVRKAISEFLSKSGNDPLPQNARLILPESMAAAEENFQLQVMRIRPGISGRGANARIRCLDHRSCGTFLVRVLLPQGQEWRLNQMPAAPATATSGPALVARGKPATLLLENASTRISLPVICLESGLLDQRIKVFDKRSRRTFVALVVGEQMLHAEL
ncbi:MAG TPA: hypothetical protein VEI26_18555 [Terriglobales bacterium]|nr:hypothetical protein [Terriglobales bacterium]